MTIRQMIDIPPVWLVGAIFVLWLQVRLFGALPLGVVGLWAGRGLIGLGLLLMAAALWSFVRARTTPVPHQMPDAMITSGVFAFSRNPIYLGDALILLGAGLGLGAVSTLVVLPAFIWLIDRRFIQAEEARLETGFPESWPKYRAKVRRWV